MHRCGSRPASRFVASLVALALVALAPLWLIWAARRRFGGAPPWSGVAPPWQWSAATVRDGLSEQLTDTVIVDVIVRVALGAVWVALTVVVFTIAAEVVHMTRHGGMALPSVRALGWSQPFARFVATGLLVILPTLHSSRAAVHAVPPPASAASPAVGSAPRVPARPPIADGAATRTTNGYTVQAGDSVYQIAARLVGADRGRTVTVAEQILDLNLGAVMSDGQRFTNAAYIEPGWVLALPADLPSPIVDARPVAEATVYIVERGDTLWSIARDELGDATRWPEIWEHNRGEPVGDDTRLVDTALEDTVIDDPHLIMPGWELDLPAIDHPPIAAEVVAPAPVPEVEVPAPASVPDLAVVASDTITAERPPPVSASPSRPAPTLPTTNLPTPNLPTPNLPTTTVPTPTLPAPAGTVVRNESRDLTPRRPADDDGGSAAAPSEGRLFGLEHAAMLSAGLLTLVGVHRLRRLRSARPRARLPAPAAGALATERTLRTIGADERLLRVDIAIRAAASQLATRERQILAVLVDDDGAVELVLTAACPADAPFTAVGVRWYLAAATTTDSLGPVARPVGAPCVSLVQLGVTPDGRDVYADLEALAVLAVDAAPDRADEVVTAIAATLGTSVLAEVAQLVGVGLDPAAFVGHRHHTGCDSFDAALDLATSLLGSTARASESTFALRTRMAGGEAWEPVVLLVASDFVEEAGATLPPRRVPGLAVVAAAPFAGACHTLVDQGPTWRLEPLGIDVVPLGLDRSELAAIMQLVEEAGACLDVPEDLDADAGATPHDGTPPPTWSLLVRLLGPVDVIDARGCSAVFERSKTRELVAWLATHRDRSTRTSARTALWDLDVRDATFSNVVSEARRSMARLVEPAPGEEWLARTLTEELPLHPDVRTDVELVEHALATAAILGSSDAIDVLRPAVDLIRGMPFEGTSYLWPDAEGLTSNFVLRATSAASELARHYLALGQIDGVFCATGQGLRVLPGHEELIALRMRAHTANGDLAGVRHEWQSYERVIAADPWSDGEPAPKLVELRHQLLSPAARSASSTVTE
jgi:LysM repeat protein